MRRGRPIRSQIRNNIEKILDGCGVAHGYAIYKIYKKVYQPTSLRNVYYHLNKGRDEGIFIAVGTERVKGNYTWGESTERKRYALGHNASERATENITEALKVLAIKKQSPGDVIDWKDTSKGTWTNFEKKLDSVVTKHDKRKIMEEYGRIIAWLGKEDTQVMRKKVEGKLNKLMK